MARPSSRRDGPASWLRSLLLALGLQFLGRLERLVRLVLGGGLAALAAEQHGPALDRHLHRRAHAAELVLRPDRAVILLVGQGAVLGRQLGPRRLDLLLPGGLLVGFAGSLRGLVGRLALPAAGRDQRDNGKDG